MGVEVDAYRRPVALHLFEAHPNDGVRGSRRRIRVDASELLHRFKVERAEQVRGIRGMQGQARCGVLERGVVGRKQRPDDGGNDEDAHHDRHPVVADRWRRQDFA